VREVRISAPAQEDFSAIVDYLRLDLRNVQAAEHFIDEVFLAYGAVRDNPYVCRTCADRKLSACGYRAFSVMRYLMIYRYDEDADVVHVARFFHELQDYGRFLASDL